MKRSPLEDDLHVEILRSERMRSGALAIVMGALLGVSSILSLVPSEVNPFLHLVGDSFPVRSVMLFYAVALLYELGARRVLRDAIERRFEPPEIVRYVNAFVETSFPTVMLVLLAHSIGPIVALHSPVPMLYFVFISLSTLRLARSLSIFTGCVAAFEYAALGLYYFPPSVGETFFTSSLPIVMKAVFMILAGVVCGFVGTQLRQRLVA